MSYPEIVIPLVVGFVLDLLIGDPHCLPHPIRLFGNLISFGEKKLNRSWDEKSNEFTLRLRGTFLGIGLVFFTFISFWGFLLLLESFRFVHLALTSVFVFYGLANRSLIQESWKVIRVLNNDGLEKGRKQLSMIVGRDTKSLNENQIRIAVLETLAENLSDGVIAPLFFYALGGVPAMMAYKMANTLDSMIGYKNKRYKNFGYFSAKFDDVLNYVPARITALLMVLVTFNYRGLIFIFKYGKKHSSPNAGYPEAALAGILNCRFGGPNIYHGKVVQKPFIGECERNVSNKDVVKAFTVNFLCAVLFVVFIVLNSIYIT